MTDVDVAVVGRGMVGAAAARHLAEAGRSVALVGSGEPADWATASGPFASHYDAGRITRVSSTSDVWSELAARSIARYGDIANRSGLTFHDPRGLVQAGPGANEAVDNANRRGGSARRVDRDWVRSTTGIDFAAHHVDDFFYEEAPAGVINPRTLVEAQALLAEAAGATLVLAPVTNVVPSNGSFTIEAGGSFTAAQILLATGAYGASVVGVELQLERRLRTIVLADFGQAPEIPTLIDDAPPHDDLDGIYWVPPVAYPDGRIMLKIGGDSLPTIVAETTDDIGTWFRSGGSTSEATALRAVVESLLPDKEVHDWDHKPCVVTYTSASLPFIGFVDDGVGVALGGCGAAAKSCDEIGRLGASLFGEGGWSDDVLSADLFAPQFER